MKSSSTFTLTLIGVLAIGVMGMYFMFRGGGQTASAPSASSGSNVVAEGDTQIVSIAAKGGYSPQVSTVKSGMPVTLRFKTNGTFDCSSTIRIPSLGISKTLPSSGETDVSLGSLQAGTLEGTCGMGMYRFQVKVQG